MENIDRSIDITDMTREELADFLNNEKISVGYLARLVQNLVETVQTIADKFDIEVDEEE